VFADIPETPIRWLDRRMRAGWAAVLAAAIVAVVFLPSSLTNHDEYYYAGQAFTLSKGRLTPQPGDPLLVPLEPAAYNFRYPVAWPAALSIARRISFRGMYVLALLVHLGGGAAFARMLVRRNIGSALAAAYVFHPVFWIYSRTILSDAPTVAALVLAMDAWENRSRVASGGWLGFMTGIRLPNGIAAVAFGLSVLGDLRRRAGDVVILVAGVALFVGVQMLVNHALGGHWLVSSYATASANFFTGKMALENALLYLAGLALLPPFSLIFAVSRPKAVDRWLFIAVAVVVAYIPVSFHNASASTLETLVGGQRYVMMAHAALLVATARLWSRIPLLNRPAVPVALGVVAAVIACLAMRPIERRHSAAANVVASCRPKTIGYSRYANLIAGSVEAERYETFDVLPTVHDPWDVLVLTPGYQGNQPGFATPWRSQPAAIAGATCQMVGPYAIYDFGGRCSESGAPCNSAPAAAP
jgi:hypothetical protein